MRRALILGAGQIGTACAARLMGDGWRVEILASTSIVAGTRFDRRDAASVAAAIGEGADLIVDTIGYDRCDADHLIPFGSGIGQLITISSASVYTDAGGRSLDEARATGFPHFEGAITEAQTTVAPGSATYSTRKVEMESRLLEAMRCPVAVLRPGAIHGAGSRHPRELWFVKRLLDGRSRVPLAYRGTTRFQTTSVSAIAALTAALSETPRSGIFNVADADSPSVAEIGRTIATVLARPIDIAGFDGPPRGSVGQSPWCVPRDFWLDTRAACAIAGQVPDYATSVPDAVIALAAEIDTIDWRAAFPALAAYGYDMFDYVAEDAA